MPPSIGKADKYFGANCVAIRGSDPFTDLYLRAAATTTSIRCLSRTPFGSAPESQGEQPQISNKPTQSAISLI